jgi:choline-sulfatase
MDEEEAEKLKNRNILIIMSDEHSREAIGCYHSPIVQTPNLDKLAARGTRFTNAYTPSPICVPARASFATGRYVHDTRCWTNAQPYDGSIPGWGHRLMEEGCHVASIGKLHYRSDKDPNGFTEEILPLHVKGGIGWSRGLLRGENQSWDKAHEFADQIGPGECSYTHYDMRVCEAACNWLRREAPKHNNAPWTLLVSFASPHYPLIVPKKYYQLYPFEQIDQPRLNRPDEVSKHPVIKALQRYMNYDDYLDEHSRLIARASYYGLCTFLDDNIGRVLTALEESGLFNDTNILYTTDHGDCLGNHGIWTKCVMFEEATAIPMLLCGPDVPKGHTIDTPVSLIDGYPTILDSAGIQQAAQDSHLPGQSLIGIANGIRPKRNILSEYHDGGSITGMFMIRHKRWKYIHYPGFSPQLFDLINDPFEKDDLGKDPNFKAIRIQCHSELKKIVDPEAANSQAFSDQAERIKELGGVDEILSSEDYDYTPVPSL